jgi:ribosomal protein S18 acetylase RimI-like enzyme
MAGTITIEALDGSDLVALAQCMALDATAFPHPSIPLVIGNSPRVWMARGERGPVGFISTMRRANVLEIAGLAVDHDHRRSGVGRTLIRTVVDIARQQGFFAVGLHVSTANEGAITLYDSEGFVATRRIRRYYNPVRFADGGDAFEMVFRLSARRLRP